MDLTEYRFSEAHTWAKQEGDEVLIGLTDFAVNELGDIIFVELPDVGVAVTANGALGTVESAKAVEDIVAPLSGEVVRVNDEVIDAPELLNEDPYQAGWLIAVKVKDTQEFDELLSNDQYTSLVEESDEQDEEEEEEDLFSDGE